MSRALQAELTNIQKLIDLENTLADELASQTKNESISTQDLAPVLLLPVLPSSAIDQIFNRFGFKLHSRNYLTQQKLFPKGVSLRGQAMSGSLYPSLAVDLIALIAQGDYVPQSLVRELGGLVEAVTQTPVFSGVAGSIAKLLPPRQALQPGWLTYLFSSRPQLEVVKPVGNIHSAPIDSETKLRLNLTYWFERLSFEVQQNWYLLALLQETLRSEFFQATLQQPVTNESLSGESTNAVKVRVNGLSFQSGEIESSEHLNSADAGRMRAAFFYSYAAYDYPAIATTPFGRRAERLEEPSEVDLNREVLSWTGCDWVGAPIVRVESQLDKYDSRLSFYLPGLHPPFNRQIVATELAFLQERAANSPAAHSADFVTSPLSRDELQRLWAEED
jgi:hypothetical protein